MASPECLNSQETEGKLRELSETPHTFLGSRSKGQTSLMLNSEGLVKSSILCSSGTLGCLGKVNAS